MTFDELWQTLPVPPGYEQMDAVEQRRWQALVEAAFRKGLFEAMHERGSARVNDSKRISDLEAAVAEIQEAMEMQSRIGSNNIRAKCMESALKVIHTWASFPESFDLEQTKRLCMSALGREQ